MLFSLQSLGQIQQDMSKGEVPCSGSGRQTDKPCSLKSTYLHITLSKLSLQRTNGLIEIVVDVIIVLIKSIACWSTDIMIFSQQGDNA